MFKLKVFEKIVALVANFSLLLNSFIPFLLVVQPVYAQNYEVVIPTIGYNQSATKLDISANTSQKIAYQLFYKTDEKIDAIIGNDLNQGDFYLGTCSFSDCLPQNINRGILKIETDSNQYRSQFFTIENNVLTVVKELDSTQSDLTVEENDFLNSSVLGDTSNWTFQNVELNKEYIAPQNSGVKLTFTKLPNNSGNIKIEEITLTPEQIEQTSALSNKAYDITSDMIDGTFEYNLSLPIPNFLNEEQVGIKYTEDINQIDDTQTVENTSETDSSILAKNLNHFTAFFIATPPFNGNISGFVGATGLLVSGNTTGDFDTIISGNLTGGVDGQWATFSGTISGNINGDMTGKINWNGYDTLFAEITNSGASGHVYLIASFSGPTGHFEGKFITQDDPIVLTTSITITGNNSVEVGNTIQMNATTDGSSSEIAWTIWTGSDPSYGSATIDQTTGLLTAIDIGKVIVIASALDGSLVTKNYEVTITPDVTPPSTPTLISPFNNTFIKGDLVTNEWSSVSDAFKYIYESYNNDSATSRRWHQEINSPSHTKTATNVADSTFWWRVKAVDAAGNESEWSPLWKVTIDSTTPPTPTITSPIFGDYFKNTPIRATWNPVVDSSGIHQYQIKYIYQDGHKFNGTLCDGENACREVSGTQTYRDHTPNSNEQGGVTISVRAIDNAGNTSGWSTPVYYSYDSTIPTATVSYDITNLTNKSIVATLVPSENIIVTNNSGLKNYTFEENGSFTFEFKDLAGNVGSAVASVNYIDKEKPVIAITNPIEGNILKDVVNISGTVTDENPHHYWLAIYRKSDGKEIYSKVVNHSGPINGLLYSWNTLGLSDGEYQIKFAERDAADNRSSDFIVNTIIDNTAPIITVNPYITNDKTPVLTGTINDNSATISVKIGTNTFPVVNDGSGNWTLDSITSNITDGTYDVVATATDTAGNTGIDSTTNELTIDSIAPKATFQHYIDGNLFTGPIAYTNSLNKLTFTAEYTDTNPSSQLLKDSYVIFDAQDDGSFRFSQNGKEAYCGWRQEPNLITGLSGNSFSLTTPENFSNCVSSLADGEYYMTHQVYDNAIRQDIPSITQFRDVLGLHFIIDTIAPTSIITTPTNLGSGSTLYINDWDGSILGTATDNFSGVTDVKVSIQRASGKYFDGIGFNSDTEVLLDTDYTNTTGTWEFDGLTNPIANSYIIRSHAIDNADNMESTYTITIIFDKTIPEVDISLNPTNPDASNGWYKSQPEITLTAADDVLTDKIEYQWDSQTGSWTLYSIPFKLNDQGAHILYYRAIDKAGNISTVGVKNIKWDQTDLENGPQNISANPNPTSGSISKIKWEIAKDNIGIDKYEIQWKLNDNNNPLSYSKTVGAGTTEVEIDQLVEGRWTVKIIAFDQSGKTKDNSIDVIVDRTGPTAPILTLTGIGAGTATLSWNAISDAKDYIIWYGSAQGIHQFGARVGDITSYTVQGLGAGNYYFIVKAVDEAQNQSIDSNEVNTGNISGAPGTTPGQPAEGFSPEVLGTDTDNQNQVGDPIEDDINNLGKVLGVNTKSLLDWWWLSLLLIIPIYVIFKKIRSKKKNH